jgi:hypothetical protein
MVKRLRIDHPLFTHGQLLRGEPASVCTCSRELHTLLSILVDSTSCDEERKVFHPHGTLRDTLGYFHSNMSSV